MNFVTLPLLPIVPEEATDKLLAKFEELRLAPAREAHRRLYDRLWEQRAMPSNVRRIR
jgi:hypothetical protein